MVFWHYKQRLHKEMVSKYNKSFRHHLSSLWNRKTKICLIRHIKSVHVEFTSVNRAWKEWLDGRKWFYQDIVIATSGSCAYKSKVSSSYPGKTDKQFYSKPSTQAKKQSSDARFVIDIDELFQLKKNGMLVESYYIGGPRYRR